MSDLHNKIVHAHWEKYPKIRIVQIRGHKTSINSIFRDTPVELVFNMIDSDKPEDILAVTSPLIEMALKEGSNPLQVVVAITIPFMGATEFAVSLDK